MSFGRWFTLVAVILGVVAIVLGVICGVITVRVHRIAALLALASPSWLTSSKSHSLASYRISKMAHTMD
jgi:hypothetical protein